MVIDSYVIKGHRGNGMLWIKPRIPESLGVLFVLVCFVGGFFVCLFVLFFERGLLLLMIFYIY